MYTGCFLKVDIEIFEKLQNIGLNFDNMWHKYVFEPTGKTNAKYNHVNSLCSLV